MRKQITIVSPALVHNILEELMIRDSSQGHEQARIYHESPGNHLHSILKFKHRGQQKTRQGISSLSK